MLCFLLALALHLLFTVRWQQSAVIPERSRYRWSSQGCTRGTRTRQCIPLTYTSMWCRLPHDTSVNHYCDCLLIIASTVRTSLKVKKSRAQRWAHAVCSYPLRGPWVRRWINHKVCDTWPVHRQTFPPGHLASLRASPFFDRCQVILHDERHTGVVACLRPLHNGAKAGLEPTTYNLKSDALPIAPPLRTYWYY